MLSNLLLASIFLSSPQLVSGDPGEAPVCCGLQCCLIEATCYTAGDANPADACLVCDPGQSNTAWSDKDDPNCAGGSTGGGTSSGTGGGTTGDSTTGGSDSAGSTSGGGSDTAGSSSTTTTSAGTSDSSTTGDATTNETTETTGGTDTDGPGSGSDSSGDGDSGGGGCSVGHASDAAWGLGLLGLVAARRRRR